MSQHNKSRDEDLPLMGDTWEPRATMDVPCLASMVWCFFFPCLLPASFVVVEQNTELVTLNCGKLSSVNRTPGCICSNPVGRELLRVSRARISRDLPETKVIDLNGNPILVSGVVVFSWQDPAKMILDVQDGESFVLGQATAVLKTIVSTFPFEHLDDKEDDDSSSSDSSVDVRPCLKTDSEVVTEQLISSLQSRVAIAGAKIETFRFNEISYAPEIASGMLKKQQAESYVQSRNTLVRGAVGITSSALSALSRRGIQMTPSEQTKLASNLLTVVCADEKVHPMIVLG